MPQPTAPLHRAMLALLAFGWASAAAAQPASDAPPRLPLAAGPGAVTIYPDQATVTRAGSVALPAGDSLVVLPGIPAGVLADSVTARGQASSPVAIGAVELRQTSFDPRALDGRRAELTARLRQVADEIAAIDVRIAAQNAQLALIERLGAGFADLQRRQPTRDEAPRIAADPAAWRTAWEVVRDGTAEAQEASRLANVQKRELEARRTALQAEINALGGPRAGSLEIVVAVHAEEATRLELAVAYQVPGAAWTPVYEVRLDSATGRVLLRQDAIVTQRTGEDWADATLTLSTARPAADARSPILQPWRIGLVDPAALAREAERRQAASEQQMRSRGIAAPAPAAMAPPPPPVTEAPAQQAQAVTATVSSAGFAVEYRIPGRASVRADGTERRVRIADTEMAAILAVHTVPRLDPRGFLQAKFALASATPTLPGRAGLYLDGVFIGRTMLPLLRPEEEITLAFGADDRVRVTYAPQTQRRGTEGSLLTGRTTSRTTEALITVRSYHSRPIEITVFDQVPISGEEGLTVTPIAEPAPSVRDVENRPGVLAWTATYAPNEERRIRFGYTVTAPRDREVTGLAR